MPAKYKQKAIERLQLYGIKPSMQRIAIMKYMMTNLTHPSADEVFAALQTTTNILSRTTVFNTLKLFAKEGAIIEIDIAEKTIRYDGIITPHAHFKCKRCNKVFDIQIDFNPIIPKCQSEDFWIDEQQFYFKGYCKKCLNP
jgi:Fe2+ or Zn2+ uptake regulation protein